jgi:hypothetical protein
VGTGCLSLLAIASLLSRFFLSFFVVCLNIYLQHLLVDRNTYLDMSPVINPFNNNSPSLFFISHRSLEELLCRNELRGEHFGFKAVKK